MDGGRRGGEAGTKLPVELLTRNQFAARCEHVWECHTCRAKVFATDA